MLVLMSSSEGHRLKKCGKDKETRILCSSHCSTKLLNVTYWWMNENICFMIFQVVDSLYCWNSSIILAFRIVAFRFQRKWNVRKVLNKKIMDTFSTDDYSSVSFVVKHDKHIDLFILHFLPTLTLWSTENWN